jgi:hypothetical protein
MGYAIGSPYGDSQSRVSFVNYDASIGCEKLILEGEYCSIQSMTLVSLTSSKN